MNYGRNKKKKRKDRIGSVLTTPSSMNRYHARSIEDLSPAARKLMQKNMKSLNRLSTPLSSKLRQAYSSTPNVSNRNRKRKRDSSVRSRGMGGNGETPSLIMSDTPKKRRRYKKDKNNFVFAKPKGSIKDRMNVNSSANNMTDGLL